VTELTPVDVTDLPLVADVVHEALRNAIIQGKLLPGERLVETQLAEQLGVSRTPVREALIMLVKDGLAVTIPRKGTIIAGLDRDDAVEIYDLREVIEGLNARRAATNITENELEELRYHLEKMRPQSGNHKAYIEAHIKFNSVIIGASRSKRIAQFMDTLSSQLRCLRGVSLATIGRQEESWKEHVQIVDALLARDAATAEALARQHVANARLAFLAQWKPGS
jgi:DNA-binding GntR family transcriptional regulator